MAAFEYRQAEEIREPGFVDFEIGQPRLLDILKPACDPTSAVRSAVSQH